MGWFKDMLVPEPIECPRGWGQVSFVRKFFILPPIFSIERSCPIRGVTNCSQCLYPVDPGSAERLRLRLVELDALRGSTLSEAEFGIRRRLIVEAQEPKPHPGIPGRAAATVALVLGPLGVVAIAAGWYLSRIVHPGFLGLLGGGLVLSALATGFTGLSIIQRRPLPSPDAPLLEKPHEDTEQLEAQLARAQDELGFFRELHQPESPGELRSPEPDDP